MCYRSVDLATDQLDEYNIRDVLQMSIFAICAQESSHVVTSCRIMCWTASHIICYVHAVEGNDTIQHVPQSVSQSVSQIGYRSPGKGSWVGQPDSGHAVCIE